MYLAAVAISLKATNTSVAPRSVAECCCNHVLPNGWLYKPHLARIRSAPHASLKSMDAHHEQHKAMVVLSSWECIFSPFFSLTRATYLSLIRPAAHNSSDHLALPASTLPYPYLPPPCFALPSLHASITFFDQSKIFFNQNLILVNFLVYNGLSKGHRDFGMYCTPLALAPADSYALYGLYRGASTLPLSLCILNLADTVMTHKLPFLLCVLASTVSVLSAHCYGCHGFSGTVAAMSCHHHSHHIPMLAARHTPRISSKRPSQRLFRTTAAGATPFTANREV